MLVDQTFKTPDNRKLTCKGLGFVELKKKINIIVIVLIRIQQLIVNS